MRPLVKSYGDNSTRTLSPGTIRIKCFRMRPATCAITSDPVSNWTRNRVLASACVTVPSTSNASSFFTNANKPCKRVRPIAEKRRPQRDKCQTLTPNVIAGERFLDKSNSKCIFKLLASRINPVGRQVPPVPLQTKNLTICRFFAGSDSAIRRRRLYLA